MVVKIRDGVVIKILPETREKLRGLGRKGESYDAVINKLIEAFKAG